jgi:hypothetical protein
MDLSRIDDLKGRLHEAKEFSRVWDWFLTNMGEDLEFMALGVPACDDFLMKVIEQIAAQIFGKRVPVNRMMLVRIPEKEFVHGSVMLNGVQGGVLYFEDIHKGMLCVTGFADRETKFVRFTGRALYDALNRSDN